LAKNQLVPWNASHVFAFAPAIASGITAGEGTMEALSALPALVRRHDGEELRPRVRERRWPLDAPRGRCEAA